MQLTQKETSFLKDLKGQEQICVDKYNKYASDAGDAQLKDLFTQIGQTEQQHLNTINQIMSGATPAMQAGGNQQSQQKQMNFTPVYNAGTQNQDMQKDSYLCTDALSTEKHVSSVYNTAVFEFKDTNIRNALNHIQKEEQQHGEQIYNYMAQNGMYS